MSSLRILRPTLALRSAYRLAPSSSRLAHTVAAQPAAETATDVDNLAPVLENGEERDPQLAGYPELPWVSVQGRSAKGWWDNQERKNFGETLHEQEDALSMWAPDVFSTSASSALLQMTVAFSAIGAFGYFIYKTKLERPVAKRSYPFDGLKEELGGIEALKANPESLEDAE